MIDTNWTDPCACIGPIDGEPCCPCHMVQCGLLRSEEHIRKQAEASAKIKAVFAQIIGESKCTTP